MRITKEGHTQVGCVACGIYFLCCVFGVCSCCVLFSLFDLICLCKWCTPYRPLHCSRTGIPHTQLKPITQQQKKETKTKEKKQNSKHNNNKRSWTRDRIKKRRE